MRVIILNSDYGIFLEDLYSRTPGLEAASYAEQMRARNESQFGTADYYSSALRQLGHEAWDVHFNNDSMQKAWAREHAVPCEADARWTLRLRRGVIPWPTRIEPKVWRCHVLHEQIRRWRPDVLLTTDMASFDDAEVRRWKALGCFVAGIGEPPYSESPRQWGVYDLVLAPSEGMVAFFRSRGTRSELLRFAFHDQHVKPDAERPIDVSFVGSLSAMHTRRVQFLEALCRRIPGVLQLWAPTVGHLAQDSPVRIAYRGPAWGREANQIVAKSKIHLNIHHDAAGKYADNIRMYDATGLGALLLTDRKKNLSAIFVVGSEVLDFATVEECHERIDWALSHDEEREGIALRGQARTMRDHTFLRRMGDFERIIAEAKGGRD